MSKIGGLVIDLEEQGVIVFDEERNIYVRAKKSN